MSVTTRSFEDFDRIYQSSLQAVYQHWTPQMQAEMASHCHPWGLGRFDFRVYLQCSSLRFYRAYRTFEEKGNGQKVCDVGGFWGAFPVTLRAMGYDVTMTESFHYYSHSFKQLFKFITDSGVKVVDYDPFQPDASLPELFDVITVMAVLEHYPHSLHRFMENVTSLMKPGGRIYIEVPNIAYWPKRINLLFGRTPLAQLKDIFKSKVPFIGHHHEFTISELKDLAQLSNLEIIGEYYFGYSNRDSFLNRLIRQPVDTLIQFIFPNTREIIAVACKKSGV